MGFATPFKDVVVYYLIGMFFNLFAPGTVGGDVSRVYYLARDGERNSPHGWARSTLPAAVSVFMDRAVGMVVLVWLHRACALPGWCLIGAYVTFALALLSSSPGLRASPALARPDDGRPSSSSCAWR
jgi:uncharacterized membrane protein YbhN (UPF0104 family)